MSNRKSIEDIYKAVKVKLVKEKVNKLIIQEERKNINYEPEYQRKYTWKPKKATSLIETILLNGIVLPLIIIKKRK